MLSSYLLLSQTYILYILWYDLFIEGGHPVEPVLNQHGVLFADGRLQLYLLLSNHLGPGWVWISIVASYYRQQLCSLQQSPPF